MGELFKYNYPIPYWLEDVPMSEFHVVNLTTMEDRFIRVIITKESQRTVSFNNYYNRNSFYYSVPIYEAI